MYFSVGIATNLQMVSSFNGSLQDDIGKLIALLEEINIGLKKCKT